MGSPLCKIPDTLFKIDKRGIQTTKPNDKKNDDDYVQGVIETDCIFQEKKVKKDTRAFRIA